MKKTSISVCLFASLLMLMGCPIQVPKCPRSQCDILELGDKLNTAKNCPSPSYPVCTNGKNLAEWEEKDIVIFDHNYIPGFYTVAQQNGFMQDAKNIAQDQAPNCLDGGKKIVYKMTYSSGLYPKSSGDDWEYLSAKVTYACCSGAPQDSK